MDEYFISSKDLQGFFSIIITFAQGSLQSSNACHFKILINIVEWLELYHTTEYGLYH